MQTCFRLQILAVFLLVACAKATTKTTAFGAEPALAVVGFPKSPIAGAPAEFWLVALNESSQPQGWTFPAEMTCRLTSSQRTVATAAIPVLPFNDAPVLITPGEFKRLQYRLILPRSITGQATMEFGSLAVNRIVFDVLAMNEPIQAEQVEDPSWRRFLRDAEPQEAGTALEPGRFFKEHFFAYEPFYFIAGTESPNAKFQISFKYRLLNQDGPLTQKAPALRGLHLAYTQTSLWDWNAESKPFYDSSYRPELLYAWEKVVGGDAEDWLRLDLQGGFQHESNGRGGLDSRSLNIAYVRTAFVLGRDDYLQLTLIPRIWTYLGDLEDNPDLKEYRGYGDLRAILGWKRGFQFSALGRIGDDWERGSLQIDATYPMMRVFKGSFSLYLHAQYFTGYGESLLGYQERSSIFRAGISLYR